MTYSRKPSISGTAPFISQGSKALLDELCAIPNEQPFASYLHTFHTIVAHARSQPNWNEVFYERCLFTYFNEIFSRTIRQPGDGLSHFLELIRYDEIIEIDKIRDKRQTYITEEYVQSIIDFITSDGFYGGVLHHNKLAVTLLVRYLVWLQILITNADIWCADTMGVPIEITTDFIYSVCSPKLSGHNFSADNQILQLKHWHQENNFLVEALAKNLDCLLANHFKLRHITDLQEYLTIIFSVDLSNLPYVTFFAQQLENYAHYHLLNYFDNFSTPLYIWGQAPYNGIDYEKFKHMLLGANIKHPLQFSAINHDYLANFKVENNEELIAHLFTIISSLRTLEPHLIANKYRKLKLALLWKIALYLYLLPCTARNTFNQTVLLSLTWLDDHEQAIFKQYQAIIGEVTEPIISQLPAPVPHLNASAVKAPPRTPSPPNTAQNSYYHPGYSVLATVTSSITPSPAPTPKSSPFATEQVVLGHRKYKIKKK